LRSLGLKGRFACKEFPKSVALYKLFSYFCNMKSAFMIAAPTSGSGKTTIARGLMALFASKGFQVQPFKCGPGELFVHYGADADIRIVEGMMGLFDGYDRDKGSSAEIASVLDIPIVLVVDAKSAAYSMAPLLQGFINFRKDVHIAGVIFNKVGSERHFQMLQQVCDDIGIECFGYLPKNAALETGSRYLGLDFSENTESRVLTNLLEKNVNYEALLSLGVSLRVTTSYLRANYQFPTGKLKVMIARKTDRKLSLGYRRFELDGKEYRGHEFHYTQFADPPKSITQVYNAKGEPVSTPIIRYKNVFASYTHLYASFLENFAYLCTLI
jgi:cobyrinic acid a,c-diamide synthase